MALPFYYVGENLRPVDDVLLSEDGVPYEIPSGSSLKFKAWTLDGRKAFSGSATIVSPQSTNPGEVRYSLTSKNLDTPGYFRAGWELVTPDGQKQFIQIRDGLTIKAVR